MTPSALADRAARLRVAISNVYLGFVGRNPARIEIEAIGSTMTARVHGIETPLESTLIAAGRKELVRREREALHDSLARDLEGEIERTAGIKLRDVSIASDVEAATDTVVLVAAPHAGEPPSDERQGLLAWAQRRGRTVRLLREESQRRGSSGQPPDGGDGNGHV
jgi:uncharacterized protein YbcI